MAESLVRLVKAPMADGEWGGEMTDAHVGDEKEVDRGGSKLRQETITQSWIILFIFNLFKSIFNSNSSRIIFQN